MRKVINKFSGEYEFLSNFAWSTVCISIVGYITVEHAYQVSKTFDPILREKIRTAKTPGIAKRLGKEVNKKGLLRPDWFKINIPIMEELLIQKFSYPEFKEKLLATDDAELIEGNYWHDNFWGKCICNNCKHIKGENNLGKLLMTVRDNLK
jgi:ribA/ribD-fused uncharacterized protein